MNVTKLLNLNNFNKKMSIITYDYILFVKFIVSDIEHCHDVFLTSTTTCSKNRPLFTFEAKFERSQILKDAFKIDFEKMYLKVYKKEYQFSLDKTNFYVKCGCLLYIDGNLTTEEAMKKSGVGWVSTIYVMITH